jgi:hypothetical protein
MHRCIHRPHPALSTVAQRGSPQGLTSAWDGTVFRAGGRRLARHVRAVAASFAVLARLLGLPTRIVVGFRADAAGGTVRAADALAWPEVLFEGIGWVPFNPLPEPNTTPRPVEEDFRPEPDESTPPPADPTLSAVATVPPPSVAARVRRTGQPRTPVGAATRRAGRGGQRHGVRRHAGRSAPRRAGE